MQLRYPALPPLNAALALVCAIGLSTGTAALAQQRVASTYKINPPPSAELNYAIDASQSGITLKGSGLVVWKTGQQQYSVHNETRAQLFGKILDTNSEGKIDRYGLAPARFTEKRLRKDASSATFNADSKTISFTQSAQTYPIVGGEQDRVSVVWQLASVARAAPKKFVPGSQWQFFVAGQRDAENWTFKVIKREKIVTAKGMFNAIHVLRAPPPDSQGQKLDIWLAPALEWYPVKLRFSDTDGGDYIEQSLDSVKAAS
jgi:hypothetical protein